MKPSVPQLTQKQKQVVFLAQVSTAINLLSLKTVFMLFSRNGRQNTTLDVAKGAGDMEPFYQASTYNRLYNLSMASTISKKQNNKTRRQPKTTDLILEKLLTSDRQRYETTSSFLFRIQNDINNYTSSVKNNYLSLLATLVGTASITVLIMLSPLHVVMQILRVWAAIANEYKPVPLKIFQMFVSFIEIPVDTFLSAFTCLPVMALAQLAGLFNANGRAYSSLSNLKTSDRNRYETTATFLARLQNNINVYTSSIDNGFLRLLATIPGTVAISGLIALSPLHAIVQLVRGSTAIAQQNDQSVLAKFMKIGLAVLDISIYTPVSIGLFLPKMALKQLGVIFDSSINVFSNVAEQKEAKSFLSPIGTSQDLSSPKQGSSPTPKAQLVSWLRRNTSSTNSASEEAGGSIFKFDDASPTARLIKRKSSSGKNGS